MTSARDDDDLTPAQRGYTAAVLRLIRARSEDEQVTAASEMGILGAKIRTEAGIVPRAGRHGPHRPRA